MVNWSAAALSQATVVARILGGIGNQLFSYAAARRLAVRSGAELVLDDVSGFERDHEFERHYQLDHFTIPCRKASAAERLEPLARVRRYLLRSASRRRPFALRRYLQQEGVDFDPRLLDLRVQRTLLIEGYWQSENYFKDIEATIRDDLRIVPPNDKVNLGVAERIGSCQAVAVHVRFFDAPQEAGGVNNAPGDYYQRAIARMEAIAPGAHYFVFSDRPDDARSRVPLPDERVTLVAHNHGDENAYADLWLMTQCRHFIIANSTFSWWGAWLARNPGKKVIAPGFEMRVGKMWWGFAGLLPDEWMKL